MKASVVVAVLLCVAVAFVAGSLSQPNLALAETRASVDAVPASLAQYYPPKNQAPAYLFAMMRMSRPFSGMVNDVLENDMTNAQSQFEAFKAAYQEVAAMVPEWKTAYAMAPIEQMEAALASGDPGQIMKSVDEVGRVCHDCHVTSMAPVQQAYRWNNFSDVLVNDPLSGQDVGFARLMLMMETNFTGIGVNLEQGQPDNARKQFAGFSARFAAMADACASCHATERHYFVDASVSSKISQLQAELDKEQINPESIGGLLQSIGQESCDKCHLVHIPAAYAQQAGRTTHN